MRVYEVSVRGWANTYVVTPDDKIAIVIDPSQPEVLQKVNQMGLHVVAVLLTHCHFDHVNGAGAFQQNGAIVFCSAQEKPLVGTSNELFEVVHLPRMPYEIDQTFEDNQTKTLCGIDVKALVTSGHTIGSTCYLFTDKEGNQCMFTGDTLFAGSIGRTDFPTGNPDQMQDSLRRLAAYQGDLLLYPGHGEKTTLEQERKTNPFLQNL